jgi:nucleoside-diphosphate-sugar epimerase
LSSIDVYGKLPTNNRFSENLQGSLETLNVRNAYAIGKRTAEALCAAYYSQYGVPVKIVRPGQIIGPGIALDDGRLCIDFISQILSNGKIVLKSDGTAKRTFIYMTDAITGMLTALLLGKCGEAYNVCDENGELTVFELAELMCSLSENKGARVEFDWSRRDSAEVTHAQSVVTGASAKIRKLSWTPKTTVSSGIKRMMDYYGL